MYYCTPTTVINQPAANAAMAILDEHREIFQKLETDVLSDASSFVTEAVIMGVGDEVEVIGVVSIVEGRN